MSGSSEATKQRLIETTIRLVSAHGVEGVSVRTLTSEAGCKNLTAIHYHFGGKQQLVDAATAWVLERMAAVGEPGFVEIETRIAAGEAVTPRDVVQAWVMPAATLIATTELGTLCMRFLSRVLATSSGAPDSGLIKSILPLFARMMGMLQPVVPQVPPDLLAPRILVMANSLVYVMSDATAIANASKAFVESSDPLESLHHYIEYHAVALAAPVTAMRGELAEVVDQHLAAWKQVLPAEDVSAAPVTGNG